MDDGTKFWMIVFAFFTALAIAVVILSMIETPSDENHLPLTYSNITVQEAKQLIESTDNLTVADIRGLEGCGPCQFNKGHLPGAGRYTDPMSLYNSTNDILVYSTDGTKGAIFCEQLLGNVTGSIYNLEGGWNAWNT